MILAGLTGPPSKSLEMSTSHARARGRVHVHPPLPLKFVRGNFFRQERELLKEIAPGITQVAVLRDASQGAGTGDFAVIQAMAPLLRMQVNAIDLRETGEIESAVAAFARSPNGGLIMPGSAAGRHYRDLIIALAARHKLPAIYSERHFAAAGGLITYGGNWIDQYRLAAGYVDRILKGEKAADLPVQAPTKYELVINLKTAKALGLTVPPSVLGRADEVIE